eukprot:scaffold21749_cov37-Phaeocystis_antarctica.AAC.1
MPRGRARRCPKRHSTLYPDPSPNPNSNPNPNPNSNPNPNPDPDPDPDPTQVPEVEVERGCVLAFEGVGAEASRDAI